MKETMKGLTIGLKTEITYKELIATNQRMVDKLKAHVDGNINCSIELVNLVEQYTELSSRTQGLLSRIGRMINKESEEAVEEDMEHCDMCSESNNAERKKLIKEAVEYFNVQVDKFKEHGFTVEKTFLDHNTVCITVTSSIGMKFTGEYTYSNNKVFNFHLFQAIALSLVLKDGKHKYFANAPEPCYYEIGQLIEFGQVPYHVRIAEISSVGLDNQTGEMYLVVGESNNSINISPSNYPYIKILEDVNINLK